MTDEIYLAEITAQVDVYGTQDTLRVASAPLGYNHPTGPGVFLPQLLQPALLQRHIIGAARTQGGSEVAFGELVVDNTTGELDDWLSYGYGSPVTIYIGSKTTAYSSLTTIMAGRVEQPTADNKTITFRIKDRQIELDKPASRARYAGTNSGSSGIEGTANDLKGKAKIRARGKVLNVDVDQVNTTQQIFALNHTSNGLSAAVTSIEAVRNNGVAWTVGTNRADLAALQAATPAQGVYDTCLSLGLIKLGGTIGSGAITADYTVGTTTDLYPANVIDWLLRDAGIDPYDIHATDITQLATDAPYDCGIVIREESYRAALDAIAESVLGWYAPDRLGIYNARMIKSPTGASAAVLRPFTFGNKAAASDFELISIVRNVTQDEGRGVPAWRVTVNYARMWLVQDKDGLAASVTEANKQKFSQQYRSVVAENAAIKDQFPEAVEITIDTLLVDETDAQAIADVALLLYGTRRDLFTVTASYDATLAAAVDLGDVVEVYHPRFNLAAGRQFNIHGFTNDARARRVEMELWG